MSLNVNCPSCDAAFTLPDNLIGKTIRCKSCSEMFPVTAPKAAKAKSKASVVVDDTDDDAPRKRPAAARVPDGTPTISNRGRRGAVADDEDDDTDDEPKKSSKLPLLIGGGVGLLVLVLGGVGAMMFLGGDDKKPVAEATNGGPAMARGMEIPPAADPPPAPKKDKPAPVADNEPPPPATKTPAPAVADPPPPVVTRPNDPIKPAFQPPTVSQTPDLMGGKMDVFTLNKVMKAGVLFKATNKAGITATGSGWFGSSQNLVFTNAHVLFMDKPNSPKPAKVTVFLNAGTPDQREIPHNNIHILAVDREIDLALIEIRGEKNLPTPLKIKPSAQLVQGQQLHTIGFPLGYSVSIFGGQTKKEPEVSVRPTTFTRFVRNDYGEPRRIQLEGGVTSGNSGGAIVDGNGDVVGVVVEAMGNNAAGSALGLGVPTEFCTGLLAGRFGEIEYGVAYRQDGKVHIPVTAAVLDPLSAIKKMGIAGWVGQSADAGKYRAPGEKKPEALPSDSNYHEIELKKSEDGKTATGELVLPDAGIGRTFWAQPYYGNNQTPIYYLPGIQVPMYLNGPPVERVPADLFVKFKPGSKRSTKVVKSGDLTEYEEGEGEGKNERVKLKTSLSTIETMIAKDAADANQAYRLKYDFEDLDIKVEVGQGLIEEDFLPKEIRRVIKDNIKATGAVGLVNKQGEMYKYSFNLLALKDPLSKAVVELFGSEPMESLLVASIPIPNRRVDVGKQVGTWQTSKQVTITLVSRRLARGGKIEEQRRLYKYLNTITYTYLGLRERQGKKEAVVKIEGKISQSPGSKEKASGGLKGLALIELDSGIVVEATMESEVELDTSGDGKTRRVSDLSKYTLSRTAGG